MKLHSHSGRVQREEVRSQASTNQESLSIHLQFVHSGSPVLHFVLRGIKTKLVYTCKLYTSPPRTSTTQTWDYKRNTSTVSCLLFSSYSPRWRRRLLACGPSPQTPLWTAGSCCVSTGGTGLSSESAFESTAEDWPVSHRESTGRSTHTGGGRRSPARTLRRPRLQPEAMWQSIVFSKLCQ